MLYIPVLMSLSNFSTSPVTNSLNLLHLNIET